MNYGDNAKAALITRGACGDYSFRCKKWVVIHLRSQALRAWEI
ncbi:hypothetical protein OL548_15185 [Lysinibacillus sp. MHQ-1]|nr:hypothetical protein OL548_15185 [Lysinibacillus sp. MHQ-1]